MVSEATLQRKIQAAVKAAGGKVIKIHGGQFSVAGTPDLIGTLNGRPFAVEVKVPGGKVTKLQEHELEAWKAQGWNVGVAYSVEEAMGIITQEAITDGK
jgi:Holliday junction resolvase